MSKLQYTNLPECFAVAFVENDKTELSEYFEAEFNATVHQLNICYPKGWHFINIATHDVWFDKPDIGAMRFNCDVCTFEIVGEPGINTYCS